MEGPGGPRWIGARRASTARVAMAQGGWRPLPLSLSLQSPSMAAAARARAPILPCSLRRGVPLPWRAGGRRGRPRGHGAPPSRPRGHGAPSPDAARQRRRRGRAQRCEGGGSSHHGRGGRIRAGGGAPWPSDPFSSLHARSGGELAAAVADLCVTASRAGLGGGARSGDRAELDPRRGRRRARTVALRWTLRHAVL